tara:strand:- start:1881 stop:2327 length:447 start_codon:yes stop_codon:yes gene_type:complete
MMSEFSNPLMDLLAKDTRYTAEAYEFIRNALNFAHDELGLGNVDAEALKSALEAEGDLPEEAHLTGQQLCEAIRQYSLAQFGYMAKTVLNSWGLKETLDFGEVVYNLIDIEMMRKSDSDSKDDFAEVYDFDRVFVDDFDINKQDDLVI